jgi:hypothetical protein
MTAPYKQLRNPLTGEINPDFVLFTDPDTGAQTTMPVVGMWRSDIYQTWLAAGNTPDAADGA